MMNKLFLTNLVESQKFVEALQILDEELATDSLNDELYYLRGNVYRRMGNFSEALNNYRRAVDINPQSPAVVAIEMLNKIFAYRNTDLLNP